jgi:hypothetical protein
VSCAGDSGNLDNRINSHQAGDTFDITTSVDLIGPKICATRTDSGAGWGMRLEIACVAASGEELQGQIVATPAINILIDNSNENIKCVEASLPVICAGDAGQLGNRINSHNAGDTFEITTDGTQVCARRTDSTNGWGMHLEITCMAAPVRVLIDSSGENTKCVTASYPVTCADDAGHLGSRVNSHQADDTFEITSNGVEVCATRTDAPVGWGMHLEIVCVATAGMGIWDGNGTCADQGRYIRHDVGTAIYWEKCGVKYWVQSCSMCDNILDFAHTPCHNHWVDQPQSYIDSLLTGGGFTGDGERFQCSQHWAYTVPTHYLTVVSWPAWAWGEWNNDAKGAIEKCSPRETTADADGTGYWFTSCCTEEGAGMQRDCGTTHNTNFETAVEQCEAQGGRLCTADEVVSLDENSGRMTTATQGCSVDGPRTATGGDLNRLWTSTPCSP